MIIAAIARTAFYIGMHGVVKFESVMKLRPEERGAVIFGRML